MAFNYEKYKNHSGNESFWTSYSDLFLGLSSIFLLLYVTASLRTSTDAIKSQVENQRLTMQVQDLQNQLKMYDSIRKDYMNNTAAPSEAQEYRELMDKLSLLQEEAKDEKTRLQREAMDNDAKEKALNKYQQMIRNVINANSLAKTKVINRDDIIQDQDQTIGTQSAQVAQLRKDARAKQALITEGENKIKKAQAALNAQVAQLKKARQQNQISTKIYEKRLAKVREDNQDEIDKLRDANEQYGKNLSETKGKLASLSGQLDQTQKSLAHQQGESANLRGQLQKAQAEIEARRQVARQIKHDFAANGVKADIDMETGDVTIDFGQHYFETGSAELKPEMAEILNKAIPTYSRSLFGDPKLAGQISAVEIVGFASPTYRGRFVDPNSSKPADRQALKYNMDLSYNRARSIFAYVLDEKKITFDHQQELVPLLKVSGRSFLEAFKSTRGVASTTDFCKVNDCKKAQRVIIRFNMDRKKAGSAQ